MEYFFLRAACATELPNNDGCYRLLTSQAPAGSCVNPLPPRAVNARAVMMKRVVSVLNGAFAKALPDRIPAASDGQTNVLTAGGVHPRTGKPYVTCLGLPFAGALGARPTKDGIDVVTTDLSNTLLFPAESFEMGFPFRIDQLRLWQDSGGPGKFRGGLGYHGICRLLEGKATLVVRHDRHDFAPWGLFGGHAAPCCRIVLVRSDGIREELPSKTIVVMNADDYIEVFTTGGGGYGDPLERDVARVLDDVLDRKVSETAAERDYGVVIRGEKVDEGATADTRTALAKARGPITWTFDRGPEFTERLGLPRHE
jgi:N-methylhydantoinase B